MLSPSIRDASEACLHGCFPMPSLGLGLTKPQTPIYLVSAAALRRQFEIAIVSSIHPTSYFTNHESLPSLQESFSNFTRTFPHYVSTNQADRIREEEYYHLAASNHVCLDYVGHGLFSYAQLQCQGQNAAIASTSSSLPPSWHSTAFGLPFFDISYKSVYLSSHIQDGAQESDLERRISKRIMAFMNIPEEEYATVFTANQSSAFKLLADSYPFRSNRRLLTVYDHENEAVKLMVESSKKRGSKTSSAEFEWPSLRLMSQKLQKKMVSKRKRSNRGLFVFPLQSRMSGTRYSYLWMKIAQENGWHVLLDACALGPKDMETLGLSLFKPDFLVCSFFKVFGESPSGFGCLFVKKASASVLEDSKTATRICIARLVTEKQELDQAEELGSADKEAKAKLELHNNGPVQGSSTGLISSTPKINEPDELDKTVQEASVKLKTPEIEETIVPSETASYEVIESGTSGDSLECRGLDHADSLGLILLSARARYLTNWLVNALLSLRHPTSENGHRLVQIYGPKVNFNRAPALAFNTFDWKGDKIDPTLVQKLASRYNISLSYGLLNHVSLSDKADEKKAKIVEKRTSEGGQADSNEKRDKLLSRTSVVSASLGLLTNFEDVYRLWTFVSQFLDADFVERERWRYTALNQEIFEV